MGRRGLCYDSASRRYIALFPCFACRRAEIGERAGADRGTHAHHQLLVISNIDLRQQHGAEHLVGAGEMMQVGARIGARRGVAAVRIERARVGGVAGIDAGTVTQVK